MAYQSRTRQRILAVRRGPDGSAFQKCLGCGVSVAIALVDMHECGARENVKRLKRHYFEDVEVEKQSNKKSQNTMVEKSNYQEFQHGKVETQRFQEFQDMGFGKQKFQDQPRSAFRFFMEEFMEKYKNGNLIEIDRMGFKTWKKMSCEERLPYVCQAYKVNDAYTQALCKEEHEYLYVDDEVESRTVGKFSKSYVAWDNTDDSEDSGCLDIFVSETCDFDKEFWKPSFPWHHPVGKDGSEKEVDKYGDQFTR